MSFAVRTNFLIQVCTPGDLDDFLAGRLRVLREIRTHNKFLTAGLKQMRDLLGFGQVWGSGYTPDYMAVGTGGTAPAAGDIQLEAEVFRNQLTRKIPDGDDGIIWQLFIASDQANGSGTQNLREAAVFNTLGGQPWNRVVFTAIPKSSGSSIVLQSTWSLVEAA